MRHDYSQVVRDALVHKMKSHDPLMLRSGNPSSAWQTLYEAITQLAVASITC